MSTQSGEVTVIGIRTPSGEKPRQMMGGFFDQYRKFRYYGCEVRIQPASMLPADPLQIGLEGGETLDPRDLLNPILFHGCHGDDLNYAFNMIYNRGQYQSVAGSDSVMELPVPDDAVFTYNEVGAEMPMEQLYYSALSDRTWRKYGVQQPFSLRLKPLVHNLTMNAQIVPFEGAPDNFLFTENGADFTGTPFNKVTVSTGVDENGNPLYGYSNRRTQLFTNNLQRLGWLPTRNSYIALGENNRKITVDNGVVIPRCYMGILLLPPSYRQEMYMRIVIVHKFGFKDFTSSLKNNPGFVYYESLPESATSEASAAAVAEQYSLDSPSANIVQTTAGVF